MNIGEVSQKSGLTPKMIRRYEEMGIVPKPKRADSGYRIYDQGDLNTLLFIYKSRSLGFSLKDTKQLIGLWKNKKRSSSQVKKIAINHLDELNEKLDQIKQMASAINLLIKSCSGDHRPHCPIIEDLATEK